MSAVDRLRYEINKCRRCEACKELLHFSCLVFPEMFRLVDAAGETGEEITTDQLRSLASLCNFCAACPCLELRTAIMDAKTEYAEIYGLALNIRAIENMDRIGRLGGAIPHLSNFLLKNGMTKTLIARTLGIHRDRKIPAFATESFPEWFRTRKEGLLPQPKDSKKVAYFSGCTANYFFPVVAEAAVRVLERNGVEVYYPEQRCCGMPPMLEGDRKLTLEFARFNVERLAKVVEEGYDIVCSCPTCGYMLKKILRVGADRTIWERDSEESGADFVHVDVGHGIIGAISGMSSVRLPKAHFQVLSKDEGYFSSISPEKRIKISEHTYDMGEYLKDLHQAGTLDTRFGSVRNRGAYYPSCHLRKQKIGMPYRYLMNLIPGLSMESIQGDHCCGNAGVMGFKQAFYPLSVRIASRLIARIKNMNPEVLATDCLSCRMQFHQLTPYKVVHPIQIIKESYDNAKGVIEDKAAPKLTALNKSIKRINGRSE